MSGDGVPNARREGEPPNADALARAVLAALRRRGFRLALAESCTGGRLAASLTAVPGASDCLWGSTVVYQTDAKRRLLGLDDAILRRHGTVSAKTTAALADSVRRRSGCQIGLAVTGWAGPEGGSEIDPVGTVYAAVASPRGTTTRRYRFDGARRTVQGLGSRAALELLLQELDETGGVDVADRETEPKMEGSR